MRSPSALVRPLSGPMSAEYAQVCMEGRARLPPPQLRGLLGLFGGGGGGRGGGGEEGTPEGGTEGNAETVKRDAGKAERRRILRRTTTTTILWQSGRGNTYIRLIDRTDGRHLLLAIATAPVRSAHLMCRAADRQTDRTHRRSKNTSTWRERLRRGQRGQRRKRARGRKCVFCQSSS